MKRATYWLGRCLQLFGLLVLPSAIWVGFMGHDEQSSIFILLASLTVFYAGYFLTRLGMRI